MCALPSPPLPPEYNAHPYVQGLASACLEWKVDGYVVWAAVTEARESADAEMAELLLTTFRYEEEAVAKARELWIQVGRARLKRHHFFLKIKQSLHLFSYFFFFSFLSCFLFSIRADIFLRFYELSHLTTHHGVKLILL